MFLNTGLVVRFRSPPPDRAFFYIYTMAKAKKKAAKKSADHYDPKVKTD
jgi:hypothetical protein